jgi:hypothetical protein
MRLRPAGSVWRRGVTRRCLHIAIAFRSQPNPRRRGHNHRSVHPAPAQAASDGHRPHEPAEAVWTPTVAARRTGKSVGTRVYPASLLLGRIGGGAVAQHSRWATALAQLRPEPHPGFSPARAIGPALQSPWTSLRCSASPSAEAAQASADHRVAHPAHRSCGHAQSAAGSWPT